MDLVKIGLFLCEMVLFSVLTKSVIFDYIKLIFH